MVLSENDIEQVSRKVAEHIASSDQTLLYVETFNRAVGKKIAQCRDNYIEWVADVVEYYLDETGQQNS